ncbi:MAG: ABC transporter ATP-binding protein, partial [Clostridia bacterium]
MKSTKNKEKRVKSKLGEALKEMLSNITRRSKGVWGAGVAYTICAFIFPLLAVILPKLIITQLYNTDKIVAQTNIIYIVCGYLAVAGVLAFAHNFLNNYGYSRLMRLRIYYSGDLLNKLLQVDYRYVEDTKFYDQNERALNAVNGDSLGIEGVYHALWETPAILLTTIALAILVGFASPIILVALLINIVAVVLISRNVHNYEYARKEEVGHAGRRLHYYENTTSDFAYGKDIRLYNLKSKIKSNFDTEIAGYVAVNKKIRRHEYLMGFITLFTLLVSDIAQYGILVYKVATKDISIADFTMYLSAVITLSLYLKMFAEKVAFIVNEGQFVVDFYDFLKTDKYNKKYGKVSEIVEDTLEIRFENVSFKYPNTDTYVLSNLNLTIHSGEKLAVVGINGAGKSTLVKLMTGLFDVTEGKITINGANIEDFSREGLYKLFGVVFQDVNNYAFTIAENIACTKENIDRDKVKSVLTRVGLWDKVKELPKGIDTMMLKVIDEDGTDLSGGEKQKLVIARALYKETKMIIMDEPTAALDALAEAEIYQEFSDLVQGKTAVYISHRLASTKFCDKIALFDNTGLIEYGNHEELMAKRGEYFKMFT